MLASRTEVMGTLSFQEIPQMREGNEGENI